jgi:hypothetical protein
LKKRGRMEDEDGGLGLRLNEILEVSARGATGCGECVRLCKTAGQRVVGQQRFLVAGGVFNGGLLAVQCAPGWRVARRCFGMAVWGRAG